MTTAQKLQVWQEDRWICQYCGRPVARNVNGGRASPRTATVDHFIPQSILRKLHLSTRLHDNLVTSCYECNQRRGKEFDNYTKGRGKWTYFPV